MEGKDEKGRAKGKRRVHCLRRSTEVIDKKKGEVTMS